MAKTTSSTTQLMTIGHSNHEWSHFLGLVRRHDISAIADVRSSPYSRFNPQYNRETLERSAREAGVQYVFLGRELGARRAEPECFDGRQARYDKIAQSPLFHAGLERLRRGVAEQRIAVMCAEKDPITCHRMVLVGHALCADPIEQLHIREDGRLESNAEAERRLLAVAGLDDTNLFSGPEELVEEAYRRQGLKLAWVRPG